MAFTPSAALATIIDAATASLTLNTNLFIQEERDPGSAAEDGTGIPLTACFVLNNGGEPPESYCNNDPSAVKLYKPAVLIRTRCEPGAFATGQALARTIRDAVHDYPPSPYILCKVRESEPLYIGEDDNRCHVWEQNVDMWIED